MSVNAICLLCDANIECYEIPVADILFGVAVILLVVLWFVSIVCLEERTNVKILTRRLNEKGRRISRPNARIEPRNKPRFFEWLRSR